MDAHHFSTWMELVGARSAREVHEKLGLSLRSAQDIVQRARAGRKVALKRTVALAMSAVALGLRPFDEYHR